MPRRRRNWRRQSSAAKGSGVAESKNFEAEVDDRAGVRDHRDRSRLRAIGQSGQRGVEAVRGERSLACTSSSSNRTHGVINSAGAASRPLRALEKEAMLISFGYAGQPSRFAGGTDRRTGFECRLRYANAPTFQHDGLQRKCRHLDRSLDCDSEAMMQSAPVKLHGASIAVCLLSIRQVLQNARGKAHAPIPAEIFSLKDVTGQSRLTRIRIAYAISDLSESSTTQLAMDAKRFCTIGRSPIPESVKEPLQ